MNIVKICPIIMIMGLARGLTLPFDFFMRRQCGCDDWQRVICFKHAGKIGPYAYISSVLTPFFLQ